MKEERQSANWSRRKFLRRLLWSLWLPLLVAVGSMMHRQRKLAGGPATFVVNASDVSDFMVLDRIIISREGNNFLAFENRCTHLGCTIREVRGDQLHCPCHGSRFDREGLPVKGPAGAPLKRLQAKYSSETGKIVVQIPG
jgi:Rieske Fe-S protein